MTDGDRTPASRPDDDDGLDRLLRVAADTAGDLDGFERSVAETLRRTVDVPSSAAGLAMTEGLEGAVGDTLRRSAAVDATSRSAPSTDASSTSPPPGATPRLRRLGWIGLALAAAIVVAVVLSTTRETSRALASAEGGEVLRAGATEWTAVARPVALRAGDSVRAGAQAAIVLIATEGRAVLHAGGALRVNGTASRVRARLLTGDADFESVAGGGSAGDVPRGVRRVFVEAGAARFTIDRGLRSQVRLAGPTGRVLIAVFDGRIAIESAGSSQTLAAGTCMVGDGRAVWARYRLRDDGLRETLASLRRRWRHYAALEARRRAVRVVVIEAGGEREAGDGISLLARRLSRRSPRADVAQFRRVPFPVARSSGMSVVPKTDGVGRFLAVHTEDDERFAQDSLTAAVKFDLPDVCGLATRALATMGWTRTSILRVAASGPMRAVATAAVGETSARDGIQRRITMEPSLEGRTSAILSAAGAGLPLDRVVIAARRATGELYAADWAVGTAFADAVGFACAAATGPAGGDAFQSILRNPEIGIQVRRRYLSGFARAGRGGRATRGVLLESFSSLSEPVLKRAVLLELIEDGDAVVAGAGAFKNDAAGDEGVAAFFTMLANARDRYAPLALAGRFLFASATVRPAVEAELIRMLLGDQDPEMRAAAARALSPREASLFRERPRNELRVSPAAVRALERAVVDPDPAVRYWSIRTLAHVGDAGTIPVIHRALASESENECLVALAHTVVRLPGVAAANGVTSTIASRLAEGPRSDVRTALITALGLIGTNLARMVLEDVRASSPVPADRHAANVALETLEAVRLARQSNRRPNGETHR